jgi:raffinose/stachyose/melibiose transport system substrate-binding protein
MRIIPTNRALRITAVAIAAGALLVGCSANGGANSDSKIVLRVQNDPTPSNMKMQQAIAKGFEKLHPNVTVKVEGDSLSAGDEATVLSGNNPPDIGLMQAVAPGFTALADHGDLLDLAKVWKNADLATRYGPEINASAKYKGKYYALSTNVLYYSFAYYNKDLFTKYGVALPKDHRIASEADLYKMAATFNKAGIAPLEVAGGTAYQPGWMVDSLFPSAATKSQMSNYLTNFQPGVKVTAKYTDSPFVDTLQALSDYKTHNVFPTGYLGVTDPTQNEAAFQAGQAAMILDGVWYDAALSTAKLPFDYDWVLLPPVKSGNKSSLPTLYNPSVIIPAHGKHLDLAQQYAEYMVSDAAQKNAVIKVGNAIPSVNTLKPSDYASLSPVVRSMIADAQKNGAQPAWTATVPGTVAMTFTVPLVQGIWTGGETPKGAAAKVQQALVDTRK